MFVSITFHPNRGEWRELFVTEAEARANGNHFRALFPADTGHWARVEPANADDAARYVGESDESYGERYAEAGSGAISLGYGTDGAYDAANAVAKPTDDPIYVAACALLDTTPPAPPVIASDDIPF